MNAVGAYTGGMSTQEISQLSRDLSEEASRARNLIDGFNRANDIVNDPNHGGMSASEVLRENYRFNLGVLAGAMGEEASKGLRIDLYV